VVTTPERLAEALAHRARLTDDELVEAAELRARNKLNPPPKEKR